MIDLPGIEQHLFMTDRWKIMLNLIIMKLVFFQEDIFQEIPEFRDVPLAVPRSWWRLVTSRNL
jgi:hypothetical protein